MDKRVLFIFAGGILFVCVVCAACVGLVALIGGGVFFLTKPVADAGSDFMEAVKTEDYKTAYAMAAPGLQNEVESAEGLEQFFRQNNFAPESWSFNNRSIENNTGHLRGSATLAGGNKVSLELDFVKIDGEWRVTRIFFEDR